MSRPTSARRCLPCRQCRSWRLRRRQRQLFSRLALAPGGRRHDPGRRDILSFGVDFILDVDRHLATFVATYGNWVYALLFAIIFVEAGVVLMPFLPGDSLLFVVGTLCGP